MDFIDTIKNNTIIAENPQDMAQRALQLLGDVSKQVLETNPDFSLALSGGHTPIELYKLMSNSPLTFNIQWNRSHLFWVDERCVSPDSDDSNYRLVADTFLPVIDIPSANVHRIHAEGKDYKMVARAYENEIRGVFKLDQDQKPTFDLMLLGMGADGHIGSLFPDSNALFDTQDIACPVYLMDRGPNRITLTAPVICQADRIVILISGAEKAETLCEVFTDQPDTTRFPVHFLWPHLDKVTWLIDRHAASKLHGFI